MKKHLIETVKNILIVLLLCSMLLLMVACLPAAQIRQTPWLSQLLQPMAPVLGLPEAELTYVETVLPVMDAASPVAISIKNEAGRHTAMWNFEELDSTFEHLGGILGQGLETARTPVVVEDTELPQALSQVGAWFAYEGMLPAGVLATWLDATMKEAADTEVHAMILTVEDSGAALYLLGNQVLRMDTDVDPGTLAFMLSEYYPDGSAFGFEENDTLPPLHLLPGEGRHIPAVHRTRAAVARRLDQLATDLGFNPYGDSNYTDAAGDTYYTEVGNTLQIKASGRVILTSVSAQRFTAADTKPNTLAEEARRLVELAAGDTLGDARLYLTGVEQHGEDTVLTFRHMVEGISVELPMGPGAQVTFSGTAVTKLELQLVTYTVREQSQHALPAVQALAILPEGSDLRLIYSDTGDSSVAAGWAVPEQ